MRVVKVLNRQLSQYIVSYVKVLDYKCIVTFNLYYDIAFSKVKGLQSQLTDHHDRSTKSCQAVNLSLNGFALSIQSV